MVSILDILIGDDKEDDFDRSKLKTFWEKYNIKDKEQYLKKWRTKFKKECCTCVREYVSLRDNKDKISVDFSKDDPYEGIEHRRPVEHPLITRIWNFCDKCNKRKIIPEYLLLYK